jgi:hypothetical protein
MKRLTILVVILCVTGCAQISPRSFDLTDFQSGDTLKGIYNSSTKEVFVTMPDSQILKGKYFRMHNATFTFAKSFYAYSTSKSGDAYALLKSETSNLMMEIIVTYQGNHGFGEAITNDGRVYKVQF